MSSIAIPRDRTARALALFLALAGCTGLAVVITVFTANPDTVRMLVTILLVAGLVLVALRSPRMCVVALIAFLTVLGLLRRLLIPIAGWSTYDPLLLVCPAITLLLVLYRRDKPLAPNHLAALIAVLLSVSVLEIFNPVAGGFLAGAAGLLFLAVPLLWFFIGRRSADDQLVAALMSLVVVGGGLAAVYGLWQSGVGLPPWDAAWVYLGGYTALNVGGATRAFSFFSSSAEYATCLAFAVVVIVAQALHTRQWTILLLPLLVWAILVASVRSTVVQLLAALLVMVALRAGSTRKVLGILAAGIGALAVLDHFLAPHLGIIAASSQDPLLAHQLGGLADPTNPRASTLLIHAQEVVSGLLVAVQHPLGLGTASTNIAGIKFSQVLAASEIDISDAFVSFGLLGGPIYTVIVVVALAQVSSLAFRRRDPASTAAVGMLVVDFGHWQHGGYYMISPLVWLLIGWASSHRRATSTVPSPPAATRVR